MKGFFKSLKRQSGFTLVELMVVVAIIGLLSSLAIPNFKKYQARSKTSEGKLQLAAIYTAEASFFSDFTIYSNCLRYMGYDPSLEISSRYYTTGFDEITAVPINNNAYDSAANSGLTTTNDGCPNASGSVAGANHFPAGKRVGASVAPRTALDMKTSLGAQLVDSMTYTAGAAGVVHKEFTADTGATGSSLITINQNKVFSVIRNGF